MPPTKVSIHMQDSVVNKDSIQLVVESPTNGTTYLLDLAADKPYNILRVYYTVLSSDDTGTLDFDILKNSTPLADFDNLTCTNMRQYVDEDDDAENAVAVDDVLELEVTGVGGTDQEFLQVKIQIEYV